MVMLRTTVCGSVELGLAIARQVDADLVAQRGQSAGQSADHVGQSASLGKGNTFRGHEGDVHEAEPPWTSRGRRAQDMMKKTQSGEPCPRNWNAG